MPWTTADVSTYIISRLGGPKRIVELDATNITEATKRAVGMYGSSKPLFKFSYINVLVGVQSYDLSSLSKPYGRGLVEVFPEPISTPTADFTVFEHWRLRAPTYNMSDIVLDKMYYDEIRRVTGTEFDWHWEQDGTQLLITPSPTRTFNLGYKYSISPADITEVPLADQGWVADFALAISKEMLGRVRVKFQGVAGNELSVDTDGSDLLSEAQSEQEALKESLKTKSGDRVAPIRG